jgi:carboxylesterase type B
MAAKYSSLPPRRYRFAARYHAEILPAAFGVYHGSELPFVFGGTATDVRYF